MRQGRRGLNIDGGSGCSLLARGSFRAAVQEWGEEEDKSSSLGYCILMQEMFPLSLFFCIATKLSVCGEAVPSSQPP